MTNTLIDIINKEDYNRVVRYNSLTIPRKGEEISFSKRNQEGTVVYDYVVDSVRHLVTQWEGHEKSFLNVTVFVYQK